MRARYEAAIVVMVGLLFFRAEQLPMLAVIAVIALLVFASAARAPHNTTRRT